MGNTTHYTGCYKSRFLNSLMIVGHCHCWIYWTIKNRETDGKQCWSNAEEHKDMVVVLCFSIGTHPVLIMPTWTFIQSPDLVCVFFYTWNSCLSRGVGSKMPVNTMAPDQSREAQSHWSMAGQPTVPPSACASSQSGEGQAYPATRMFCPATSSSKLSSKAEMFLCLVGNGCFSGGAWKERRGIYVWYYLWTDTVHLQNWLNASC